MAEEFEDFLGVLPVDFLIQGIIEEGLALFRSSPENFPNFVFGHLGASYLQKKYGQAKIDELSKYIRETQIPVVQHWSLVDVQLPCFSITLLDGREDEQHSSLADFLGHSDTLNEAGTAIEDRTEFKYAAIEDQIQIGIHNNNTPDLTKYLYYFLVNIFITSKKTLINRGIQLTSWNATDISRVNEYLPNNVFSRFVNFSCFTTPKFTIDEEVPIITDFDIDSDEGGTITPVE